MDYDAVYYDEDLETPQERARENGDELNAHLILDHTYYSLVVTDNDPGIDFDDLIQPFLEYLRALIDYRFNHPSVYYRFYLFKRDITTKAVQLLASKGYEWPPRSRDFIENELPKYFSDVAAYYFEDY